MKPVLLPSTPYNSFYKNASEQDKKTFPMIERRLSSYSDNLVIYDGPPYANGNIHIGHAVNKVLKDFICRSRESLLRLGWDCHGLPIEWKVEELYREEGISKSSLNPLEFRKRCYDYASSWVDTQMEEFKSLGLAANYANYYATYQKEVERETVKSLHDFIKHDSLYSGIRPILWSVAEQTALADAEVEYEETRFQSLIVKFPNCSFKGLNASVLVWTTTPWTLPGNKVIALKSDHEYILIKYSGDDVSELFLIASECYEYVTSKKDGKYEIIEKINSNDLIGETCNHPLLQQGYSPSVKIVQADFVEVNSGTGFVHIAPACGPDDFRLGKQLNLDIEEVLTADGKLADSLPVFGGLQVLDDKGKWGSAQKTILDSVSENGNIFSLANGKHRSALSWRSKTPLLYRITKQWFIKIKGNKHFERFIEEKLPKINFSTEESKNRFYSMVKNRPDWCISRQRVWGVPVALIVEKETGNIVSDDVVLKKIQNLILKEGSDTWWKNDVGYFLPQSYDATKYEKVMDVLDVWFESGSVTRYLFQKSKDQFGNITGNIALEGSDQHRGWFQSSMLVSMNTIQPISDVITHGFVLDKKGKKMSKSVGNVISPQDIIKKYGADAFRVFVAMSDYTVDIRYSDESMKIAETQLKKVRNTLRWLLGVMPNFDLYDYYNMRFELPEKWIYMRTLELNIRINEHMEKYEFSKAWEELYSFCNHELSTIWCDYRKDLLYCDGEYSDSRKNVQMVVWFILDELLCHFEKFIPFTVAQVSEYYKKLDEPFYINTNMEEVEIFEKFVSEYRSEITKKIGEFKKENDVTNTLELEIEIPFEANFDAALLFNVSKCHYGNEIRVFKTNGHKCKRCWKYYDQLTNDLCIRCVSV